MKRLTTETPKDNLEAALNLFYIKDHETWVRGGGPGPEYADVSLFDFIRDVAKTYVPDVELPGDNDDLSDMMPEWLMDGIDSAEGVVALLYTAAWAYAELRHKLMRYEDTGMNPEEIKNALDVNDIVPEINVTVDHIRDLIQAEQAGQLVMLPFQQGKTLVDRTFPENPQLLQNVRVAVAYESSGIIFHYPFNTFIQNVKSGCIFQVSDEAEAALAGKGGVAPDAPEEPEWKSKAMRTFFGGSRSE